MIKDLFFQLIQVALGHRSVLSQSPSATEWRELLDMSVRQSLVGVCGSGVERLPASCRPPRDVAIRWAALVSGIEQRNKWLNVKCGEITELLAFDGFTTCILKGQGVAQLYPDPLRRQSGDIDILCRHKDAPACSTGMDEVVAYVRGHSLEAGKVVYHHADMTVCFGRLSDGNVAYVPPGKSGGMEIEMHYRPSWFYSPLRNRRFQQWAASRRGDVERSACGTFFVPTLPFNAVYLLVHIYRHLFDEGIGLRQMLDYYYVLSALGDSDEARAEAVSTLRRLGMCRFCGAVMYVLHEVFAMPERLFLVPADEREGRFLLDEIMLAGNFGRYDARSRPRSGESLAARFVRRQRRVARFLVHYPEETVFAPLWTLWQWTWRRMNGY